MFIIYLDSLKEYTDATMSKMLQRVYKMESSLNKIDMDSTIEQLVLDCRGDIKMACNELFLRSLSQMKYASSSNSHKRTDKNKKGKVTKKKTDFQNDYGQEQSQYVFNLLNSYNGG